MYFVTGTIWVSVAKATKNKDVDYMYEELKKRKKYYVTFSIEIDGLLEGDANMGSGEMTELQARKQAMTYLKTDEAKEMNLSGISATFHDIELYNQKLWGEAEVNYMLYTI